MRLAGSGLTRALAIGAMLLLLPAPSARAQSTVEASDDFTSFRVVEFSRDGRYLLMDSNTSGDRGVVLFDRQTNSPITASVDSRGNPIGYAGYWGQMTDDGRFVTFYADYVNPVTNVRETGVHVRDRLLRRTRLVVSYRRDHLRAANLQLCSSGGIDISHDGRYVVVNACGGDLVPGDTRDYRNVYLVDTLLGSAVRVSSDVAGNQADGDSYQPAFTAGGKTIVFTSNASNLVAADLNGKSDIFRYDVSTRQITTVSTGPTGEPADGDSTGPAVSDDGRYVAFMSKAANLVPGDTNDVFDVYTKDLVTGEITRASLDPGGHQFPDPSYLSSMSPDGSRISFATGPYSAANTGYIHHRTSDTSYPLTLPFLENGQGVSAFSTDNLAIAYGNFPVYIRDERDVPTFDCRLPGCVRPPASG